MESLARVAAAGLLLVALLGLCVHYGAVADERGPYPTTDEIDENYGAYVGEDVLLFGDVLSVDGAADRATVRVDTSTAPFEMTVTRFSEQVQPGGVVQVYGTLRTDRTIDARNVAVVNPAGSSDAYKYAVSVVGAALVLVLFSREWRVEPDALAFEVRDGG